MLEILAGQTSTLFVIQEEGKESSAQSNQGKKIQLKNSTAVFLLMNHEPVTRDNPLTLL